VYYRLLGTDIASGARISLECDQAEYDLVTVGRNAAVELCTLRGFAVDNGAMMLGPVSDCKERRKASWWAYGRGWERSVILSVMTVTVNAQWLG